MALTLADTREAFDSVAAQYHRDNVDNPVLAEMRRRVIAIVSSHVPAGSHILDLGCGPGTDDETLGARGYRVTAIDWSPEMVQQARRRIAVADLADRVTVHQLGIHELDALPHTRFDAALSNFGALNCVPDLAAVADRLGARLGTGAVVVASVIGRCCPWELGIYLRRGDIARASVRWRRDAVAVPLNGRTVWTRYYSPREFTTIFARAGFALVSTRALGAIAPPPYASAFAGRHPRVVDALWRIEDRIASWPLVRAAGDHFVCVLRRS